MSLPPSVQPIRDHLLALVQNNGDHHVTPRQRHELLRACGVPQQRPPVINRFRGWLGIITARRVLPTWHAALPIWVELPEDVPDYNLLPDKCIALAEAVMTGRMDLQEAWQEVNNSWYIVSNIGDELLVHREDVPFTAYYACDAALRALYEALNMDFLDQMPEQANYSDETLPDLWRDSASAAVLAHAGDGETDPVDNLKRHEFWEWWLQEALPTAWERASE